MNDRPIRASHLSSYDPVCSHISQQLLTLQLAHQKRPVCLRKPRASSGCRRTRRSPLRTLCRNTRRSSGGQGGRFEVGPQLLHRVEIGRVRGQPHDGQPRSMLGQRGLDHATAVRRQAIPHQDHATPHMLPQRRQESDDLSAAHGARMKCERPARSMAGDRLYTWLRSA